MTYQLIPFTWKYLTWIEDVFINTTVTDAVIFDYIMTTTLIVVAKLDNLDERLMFQIPHDFVCTAMQDGFCPAGLEIVMNIKRKMIEKVDVKDTCLSNEQVLLSVVMVMSTWVHPQIHISSEKCARDIAKQPSTLKQLKESTRHTIALHDVLLNGPISLTPADGKACILTVEFNNEAFLEYAQRKKSSWLE